MKYPMIAKKRKAKWSTGDIRSRLRSAMALANAGAELVAAVVWNRSKRNRDQFLGCAHPDPLCSGVTVVPDAPPSIGNSAPVT